MRKTAVALVAASGLFVLSASLEAAPLAPAAMPGGLAVTEVAGGCGPGMHPRAWRDAWGRWVRQCVPNAPVVSRCGPGMVWRRWRGPYGNLHAGCVPI